MRGYVIVHSTRPVHSGTLGCRHLAVKIRNTSSGLEELAGVAWTCHAGSDPYYGGLRKTVSDIDGTLFSRRVR